jgi:hypothetical protein
MLCTNRYLTRDDQLLLHVIVDKLPLADMLPLAIFSPDFMIECTLLLTFIVLICAVRVQTRVKFAFDFGVGKMATWAGAFWAVAAERHIRMLERTSRISAIWIELALRVNL